MKKIDSSKLAELIMEEIRYTFDSYYTQGSGDIEIEEMIKSTIEKYVKKNNKS